MNYSTTEYPYIKDTTSILDSFSPLGHLVSLESASRQHENGQWSIIAAGPIQTIPLSNTTQNTQKQIDDLKNILPYKESNLPFIGGVIGHIGYGDIQGNVKQAKITAGLYTWALLIDHKNQRSILIHWHEISNVSLAALHAMITSPPQKQKSFCLRTGFKPIWKKNHYSKQFKKIINYIIQGDVYQVNLTQLFKAKFTGNTRTAYSKIKQQSHSPYLVYFESDDLVFLSASPEQFIQSKNNKINTKPIKGTMPRSENLLQDASNITQLKNSSKDKAENIMITDLLRNDLSIHCSQIRVDKLHEIESFEAVHHMVSSISAIKPEDIPVTKVFLSAFPGGSITGAPKKRAMEIISELECFDREFYCGSTFYYSANDDFSSNILIRSFVFKDGEVKCWAGGGITIDSKWELEYQESLDKVSRLMNALSS